MQKLINYFGFLVGWYSLVQYGNDAIRYVLLYIVIHILCQSRLMLELVKILIVAILGIGIDCILLHYKVISFTQDSILPPYWFMSLWPLFATMLNHCLLLCSRFPVWVNAGCGFFGGILAYMTATHIQPTFFYHHLWLIGLLWMGIFPFFIQLSYKINQF